MADQSAFTRIPNNIIEAMPTLGNAELRVLLAIARKTVGWQKECDVISVSQIVAMTGLTSRNAQNAITALLERGFLSREKAGKQTYCYTLQTVSPRDTVENHIPSDPISPRDTVPYPLGTRFEAKPYPLGTTQKKDLKEKKERGVDTPARPLSDLAIAIADVCKIDPLIATAKQKQALNTTYTALNSIGATAVDVRARETWWYANAWQAKKEGRAPRPDELQAIWKEAAAPVKKPVERVAPTVGMQTRTPPPADAQPAQQTAAKMQALLNKARNNDAT